MLCQDGKVALCSFSLTLLTFCGTFLYGKTREWLGEIPGGLILGPIIYFAAINVLIKLIYRGTSYQVAVRAALLGFLFSSGLYTYFTAAHNAKIFGIYMCVMSTFHYTEFMSIAIIQPNLLSTDSFVINHSPQYTIAAVTSWIEFAIELYLFPRLKSYYYISYVGLSICIAGELLRKVAMFTAKSNFNHLVQCEKNAGHVLVTHGVYSIFRHPSYVGWFYWSIGTQIILLNPCCFVAYAVASWLFFKERIEVEEIALLNFFGQQYCDYQHNVATGLPFIQGYTIRP